MPNTVEVEQTFKNVQHSENAYVGQEHHSNDPSVEGEQNASLPNINDVFHDVVVNILNVGETLETDEEFEDTPLDFDPTYPLMDKWMRSHPHEQILGDSLAGVLTRAQIRAKNEKLGCAPPDFSLISKPSDKKSKSICILRRYLVPPPSSLVVTSLPCSVAARWSRYSPPQQLSPEISFLKLVSPFTTLLSLELVVASGVPCCRRCAPYDFIGLPHKVSLGHKLCYYFPFDSVYKVGTMAGGAADCQFWYINLGIKCRLHELANKSRISMTGASKMLANILYSYRGMGLFVGTMIGSGLNYVDSEGRRLKGTKFYVGSVSLFALVERMAVLDEANFSRWRNGSTSIPSTSMGSSVPNGVIKTTAAPLVDLLDLGGGEEPPPPNTNSMMTGDNFLQDLLDVGMSPSSSQPNKIMKYSKAIVASQLYEEPVDPSVASQRVEHSGGQRVCLDLQKLDQFSFFPGQVAGIEGHNPSGHYLIATKIVDYVPLSVPNDENIPQKKRQAMDENNKPGDLSDITSYLSLVCKACSSIY
ncbi:unnamed protein product [Lactuca saligna]|uniref:DNA polymerase alpha subunit B OB domain-containing protein n=1 Tax=Lactuca saligna TaxID=75948 RepID=A0AA36EK08_LACSI|nr:unnamed protein product [Lactuca saligna]